MISKVAQPTCATGRDEAAELADHAEVGREAVLAEEVRQVLAAPEGRLVQPDGDDHELAGERAALRGLPRAVSAAHASAPFMSAVPRP